jgi:hypothetical protein
MSIINMCNANAETLSTGRRKPSRSYVVSSNAGSRMPTECPVGGFRCGTTYPIYLSKGMIQTSPV